jgi:hypothetical protein
MINLQWQYFNTIFIKYIQFILLFQLYLISGTSYFLQYKISKIELNFVFVFDDVNTITNFLYTMWKMKFSSMFEIIYQCQ